MWLPTTLNSLLVAPHVLKNIALTGAVVETNHGVLELMEKEFEQSGDYSAASQALELMVQSKLSEEDMKDTDLVRAKVHDMAKLGEMKWRYRVVDEGQSPRDEAIHILTEARPTRTTQHPPPSSPRPPPLDLTRPNSRPPRAKELVDHHMKLHTHDKEGDAQERERQRLRKEWAEELSDVVQGLGLTRLIFNTDRSEDALIEKALSEALELRQLAGLRPQMADTLNGLGSLKQKQRAYHDAEKIFRRALEIREHLPEGDDHGKSKEQTIAQSLVSLGNLFSEMGDQHDAAAREGSGKARAGSAKEEQRAQYAKALEMLQGAKE
eukprot:4765252-Prymnesium_polylepis.1